MLQELIANAFVGGLLNMIGIPGIVGLAAAGLVGWKLMAGAKKPMLLLALLAIGGFFAWRMMPTTPPPPPPPPQPGVAQPSPVAPLPKYPQAKKGERPLPPRTYAEMHKPSIDDLEAKRIVKATKEQGAWPPPQEWRDKNLALALAKNDERKRKDTLLAQAEEQRGFASVPPSPPAPPRMMTPGEARAWAFDMESRRIDEVRALSLRMQHKYGQPEAYAGAGERRWR